MTSAQRLVLLGRNIAHSRSPAYHNARFAERGLDWRYDLMPVEESELADAIAMMKGGGYRGANVTSPYKEMVVGLMDEVSDEAARIGAVNTILFEDGRALGYNTDIAGFRFSLRDESFLHQPFTAAVLGTGGAARAAVDVLLGYPTLTAVSIYSRSLERAEEAARRWDNAKLRAARSSDFTPADLVVHATPVGLGDGARLLEADDLRGVDLLYEMIYHPAVTPLMEAAASAGARVKGGLEMFEAQAAESLRIWTSAH